MEHRRFSQTMASEWQTAFVVSHKMPWRALLTAVKNYNKSLEKLHDFFFKTETKTKTKGSRPRPRLSFLSSRRLETKTLVSRTTSLMQSPNTGFEPSLTVVRAASGVGVIPVTCELHRSLDQYLAVLVCSSHGTASLRIHYLKPTQCSVQNTKVCSFVYLQTRLLCGLAPRVIQYPELALSRECFGTQIICIIRYTEKFLFDARYAANYTISNRKLVQSCPWVGLTRGFG